MSAGRTLYGYFRSSAAWRVRIALAWKGLDHETVPVHLRRGEQRDPAFLARNPLGLVPMLEVGGEAIPQSLAICEYLEESHPQPPLMPAAPMDRARVRAVTCTIACDIHPIDNLRVLQYLKRTMGQPQDAVDEWYRHWIRVGFDAVEQQVRAWGSDLACVGSTISLADVFLVPQVANARRVGLDLAPWPCIARIEAHLAGLPAFRETAPDRQPDYEA